MIVLIFFLVCPLSLKYSLSTFPFDWQGAPLGQRDHSGLSPLVWAAICGNVEAVETLLNVNDGGTLSKEQGEGENDVRDTSSEDQKSGAVKTTQNGEEVNDRDVPSEKQEKGGAEATEVNDGDNPSEKQQERKEGATKDEGDLSTTDGGSPSEGQVIGGGEKEEVFQPLHAAASVGSEKVCTVLINAGVKVHVHYAIHNTRVYTE